MAKAKLTARCVDREITLYLIDEEGYVFHTEQSDEVRDAVLKAAVKYLHERSARFSWELDGTEYELRATATPIEPSSTPRFRVIEGGQKGG